MESTWYLFPGQTKENTKVEERGKALIASREAWQKITNHLDRKKIQVDILQAEEDRRQYLKQGSYAMTKNWENSIEKISQRRMEEHDRKVRVKEEQKYLRFLQLRKEQEEERNKIVVAAKRQLYMFKEKPRSLNSALLLSEVLFERNLQQEFDQREIEHERIKEAKYAQVVRMNAQDERDRNAAKKKKRLETNVQHSLELKQQVKDIEDAEREEREERIKVERLDNIRAVEEMTAIKAYEKKLDRDKKADVKKEFHKFLEAKKEYKIEVERKEAIKDRIVDIYDRAKCSINKTKKKIEKEIFDNKILVREKIGKAVMAEAAGNKAIEDEILENARIEYEAKALDTLEKKRQYKELLRKQREDYRQQCLARKAKEANEEKQLQKWELLNRLKTNEVVKQYNLEKEQRLFDEKIAYRKVLFQQMDDLAKELEDEKECGRQELQQHRSRIELEDKDFFTYADEVFDLAKSRGRDTSLITKVIDKYKIENGLEPKKKNTTLLQSKVPINNKNA